MHFNELIMRWRLQAIGGLAGPVTLAGFIVGDAESLLVLSLVLIFGWIGVAIIDLFYHRRLLQGSVDAILALESKVRPIDLSTAIERRAKVGSGIAPWIFYVCGLLPLLVILGWAVYQLCRVWTTPAPHADRRAPAPRDGRRRSSPSGRILVTDL